YDLEVDRRQVEMALAEENCVLGSRLAIWMLKEADLKVYLTASSEERARRITEREGGSLAERMEQTQRRDENDSKRYLRLYAIDNSDTSIADLVIDTSDLGPQQVADIIIAEVQKREEH
ncbi:MAG: cytidylate kinase, partial [Spirochaetia bacterium]|nr:cytidylate kinase [Spirochaetia bacterium]